MNRRISIYSCPSGLPAFIDNIYENEHVICKTYHSSEEIDGFTDSSDEIPSRSFYPCGFYPYIPDVSRNLTDSRNGIKSRPNGKGSTRLHMTLLFDEADEGKHVTFTAAWINPRLQHGPWSDAIKVLIN
ncbi:MAG: hypothetical protein LBP64_03450 [Tannerella sp.]|jgi:hypothetical protein|nr:hypothetical protein [Tannerella sp.]